MIIFFEGGAGTGKTHSLIECLSDYLTKEPLREHQKILSLTFMHGSRRRLLQKLSGVQSLKGHVECKTLDSFAGHVYHRWLSLRKEVGIGNVETFEEICAACATLLSYPEVRTWVSISYPFLILDEAQDLSNGRLKVVKELSKVMKLFVAADEFQFLEKGIAKNDAVDWLRSQCKPQQLNESQRTSDTGLITIAAGLRNNVPLLSLLKKVSTANGKYKDVHYELGNFKLVIDTTAKAQNMGQWKLWLEINARKSEDLAIITPSRCSYAIKIIEAVSKGVVSKKGRMPALSIHWEDETEDANIFEAFPDGTHNFEETLSALQQVRDMYWQIQLTNWIHRKRNVTGQSQFSKQEIKSKYEELKSLRKFFGIQRIFRRTAMTIHQAKNREFHGVIIIWPYAIPDDDLEYVRRLMYNGITRAKSWCTLILQGSDRLKKSPFV